MDTPSPRNIIHEEQDDNGQDDTLAPPTFDPSSFNASLNAPLPTFKPRKSNRVSVLAYSTEPNTSTGPSKSPPPTQLPSLPHGGPPSLFGIHGASSPSPPPANPGGPPPGMKLPPPPMKGAANPVAPLPYTKGDFRTAGIVNHWNDPPTQIFQKSAQGDGAAAHDFGPMKETLTKVIQECSANVSAPQKRMFEDTTKRLQTLLDQMDSNSVKERVVGPLGDMIQALSTRSFTECQAIHAKLMQTDFDSEGKWLLGFKRLIDLYASIPKTA
ncbi:hypothetical protein BG000_003950 [Podila horticola]|nr:hypothetical protein BG000_003950 [Podila horticola]